MNYLVSCYFVYYQVCAIYRKLSCWLWIDQFCLIFEKFIFKTSTLFTPISKLRKQYPLLILKSRFGSRAQSSTFTLICYCIFPKCCYLLQKCQMCKIFKKYVLHVQVLKYVSGSCVCLKYSTLVLLYADNHILLIFIVPIDKHDKCRDDCKISDESRKWNTVHRNIERGCVKGNNGRSWS